MVDRDLRDDFYRAYAYFRWMDDFVDVTSTSNAASRSFMARQRDLVDRLYNSERPPDLEPEERIAADLIDHDRGPQSGLQSFIRNMLAIIEFDANRKGRLISQSELAWYTDSLAASVTDGIQYFVGNGHPYPDGDSRYAAGAGAHIAHLLRDMLPDTADGFVNIPSEYLDTHRIGPADVNSSPYREWVHDRVELARSLFAEGKQYLDQLGVLRCKIVGYWYCARFEGVLDAIERDGYILREAYRERFRPPSVLKIAALGASVTLRHAVPWVGRDSRS